MKHCTMREKSVFVFICFASTSAAGGIGVDIVLRVARAHVPELCPLAMTVLAALCEQPPSRQRLVLIGLPASVAQSR